MRSSFTWATLGVGILFAVVVLLPHLWQRLDARYPFQGIEMLGADSEPHYASRTREIRDGFLRTGNVFYAAPKEQPYLQPPLPEMALAALDVLLPTDLPQSLVLSKGLLAVFLTLSMTWCFACITRRRWESLLAVSILLFATVFLTSPWSAWSLLAHATPGNDFLRFARAVNPLWTDVWFFLVVGLLASWLRGRERWKIVLAAICTVILLYSYVWAWTYLGIVLAALFLHAIIQRSPDRCRDLLLFAGIFLVLGIPFLLNMWEATHHPAYAATAMRLGLAASRAPIVGVWLVLFLLFSFLASRRLWPDTWPLLPALALAGLIAINQQLLTGKILQPHHYHWYFLHPLASVLLIVAVLEVLRRFVPRVSIPLLCAFTVVAVVPLGILFQWRSFEAHREEWGTVQQFRPVLEVLRERAGPGDVIFAPASSPVSELVPLYTSANVYTSGNANNYLTSMEKARDVLFFQLWLEGLTPEEADRRFPSDLRFRLSSRLYSMYYRELLGDFAAIPDDIVAEHIAAYRAYDILSPKEKLSRYPLDVLVLSPGDTITPRLRWLRNEGETVYDRGEYVVVVLRHAS